MIFISTRGYKMNTYGAVLQYYLCHHPKDALLIIECDGPDFAIECIAIAYGKDLAQVMFDLREKADEMWPAEHD
jgi:hypothetical protein